MIPRDEILAALRWLRHDVYTPSDGSPVHTPPDRRLVRHPLDDEGIAAWICDVYLTARASVGHVDALHRVYAAIQAVVRPSPPPPPRSWTPEQVRELVLSGRLPPPAPFDPRGFQASVLNAVNDPLWGRLRQPIGNISHDTVAWNVSPNRNEFSSPFQHWDIVQGSTGPNPRPAWQDQTGLERPGATFEPWTVAPPTTPRLGIDRLSFTRDQRRVRLAGVSSFDLSQRLRGGDRRWIDQVLVPLDRATPADVVVVARVMVATAFRAGLSYPDGIKLLPQTLSTLAKAGIYAEVVAGVDLGQFGIIGSEFRRLYVQIVDICDRHPNTILEVANENTHPTQAHYLTDPAYLRDLAVNLTAQNIPVSAGSSHGGEPPQWNQGRYLTHHADRGSHYHVNATIMAQAAQRLNMPILDDEPIGIAEVARPGSRTADPEDARRQVQEANALGLAGTTLHLDAGLTAQVDALGPVQREALKRFGEAW